MLGRCLKTETERSGFSSWEKKASNVRKRNAQKAVQENSFWISPTTSSHLPISKSRRRYPNTVVALPTQTSNMVRLTYRCLHFFLTHERLFFPQSSDSKYNIAVSSVMLAVQFKVTLVDACLAALVRTLLLTKSRGGALS